MIAWPARGAWLASVLPRPPPDACLWPSFTRTSGSAHSAFFSLLSSLPVSSAAASHAPAAPAAAPSAMAPMAAPQQSGGMMSGIIGGIAQGFMFGTGSAVAHRAVDAVMGPRTIVHEQAPSKDAPAAAGAAAPAAAGAAAAAPLDGDTMVKCQFEKNQLQRCMKANDSDVDACRSYLDAMDSCKAAYRGV